jgi:hypothetical protein
MKARTHNAIPVLTTIGVDIGKDIFHIVGFDADGKIALRRKIKRLALAETFKKLPPCIVGMEACLSAHFVSRTLRVLGHQPRIIPAIYVKPFVKGQKNDYNDAEAIAEAALRPNLRVVREKTQDQLDLQACHRDPTSPGLTTDGDDQPDPRLSRRTRDHREARREGAPQLALQNIEKSRRRDFGSNEPVDRRALRRLALAGRTHRSGHERD